MAKFNLDKVSTTGQTKKEGIYNLKIVRCEKIIASTGSKMIQMDYIVEPDGFKVNYDNYPYAKQDGSLINFGLSKLKLVMKATGTYVEGDFDDEIIPTLLKGKVFSAELSLKEGDKYLKLNDINTIAPALNLEQPITPESFNDVPPTAKVTSTPMNTSSDCKVEKEMKEVLDTAEIKVTDNWDI